MRSADREHAWFETVAQSAGSESPGRFFAGVWKRLEKGAEEYGDLSFLDRDFVELVAEARQEGEDFPGWLVLAIQRLERDRLPADVAEQIERILVEASAKVLEAWQIVGMALDLYDEHRPPSPPTAPASKFFEE